ncbi:hypothetical protein BJ165DRAFT_1452646 [Panaeolus papilionaceus]|nr:hypothetical protein BJ165DRAFT_1452646 [Panaeolus papilionaceus]
MNKRYECHGQSGTNSHSIHLSGRPYSSPVPVIKHPVPLPQISAVPVTIHPLLRSSTIPNILFDLNYPPNTIALGPYLANVAPSDYQGWLNEPAAFPSDICSLTIRVVGVERPVVILAATNTSAGFITVWDVLYACHRAWRQAKAESRSLEELSSTPSYHLLSPPSATNGRLLFSSDNDYRQDRTRIATANQMNTGPSLSNQCYFQHSSYWNGLRSSEVEPEVWVLQPLPPVRRR